MWLTALIDRTFRLPYGGAPRCACVEPDQPGGDPCRVLPQRTPVASELVFAIAGDTLPPAVAEVAYLYFA